jgi:signal transduction histidine kinase
VPLELPAAGTFDTFPGPVFIFDPSGRLYFANLRARKKLGYARLPPPVHVLESPLPPSGPQLVELKLRTSSGRSLDLPCLVVPWKDWLVALSYGGAERKLMAEISELQTFRDALARFLVNDLNNGLTGVLGSIQLLRMDDNTNLTESQRKLVETAHRSGQELRKMIQNILDVTKMEESHLRLKREGVPVATLFQRVVDDYHSIAELMGKRLRVRLTDPSLMVDADMDMILRVISNLVTNALKSAPRGGEIMLESDITDEGWVWVAVSDTGPGIAREFQEKVFEKFFQIPKETKRQAGAGLGLAFCRMAVEAHGGRIWVESEPGEGSRFKFTLPAA